MFRLIDRLNYETSSIPRFIESFYNSLMCVNRVEEFLNCESIEKNKYYENAKEDNQVSVKIEQSNFFWGLDEAKFDEMPEKVEKSTTNNEDVSSLSKNQDGSQKVVSLDTKV